MSLKAKVEAIIYATEEPVTLNELSSLLKDAVLSDLHAQEQARLALNETVSDGPPVEMEETEEEEAFAVEEAAAVFAGEASMDLPAELPPPEKPATPIPEDRRADEKEQLKAVKTRLAGVIEELIADYASPDRGMEIRQIAGGYRMATKPEHHDVVVSFAKSLKPPVRLSLQALETLAVIAYKQPVTVPEISEIRGVDSAGVIATLLDRKLITTGGRKQVIGRPILYKTTKEFLMRFGLKDIGELPSMEEFEKLGDPQADLFNPGETGPGQNSDAAPKDETEAGVEGLCESEAAAAMAENPASETSGEQMPGEGDTSEPVTEAVPEASDEHSLVGERTVGDEGTFATEAEPESSSEKS